MRTFTLFCSLFVAAFWLKAQNIPDANFAAAIRQQCPTCIDANNDLLPAAQTLTNLNVYSSNIADLTGVAGFTNLEALYCGANQLTSLPILPNSLVELNCPSNQLTSLPTLPNSLTRLYCDRNQLTSLPNLPNLLSALDCSTNALSTLPVLPNSLTIFACSNNPLIALPSLLFLNSLTYLDCDNCQLLNLPALPSGLTEVYCGHNQLTNLPALPNSLSLLSCEFNQLTSLPNLPSSLGYIWCGNNNLYFLPQLPNILWRLYCSNNPNLFCLPLLSNDLTEVHIANTNITCIPNLPPNVYFDVATPSLCNLNNPNNCPSYNQVQGQTYFDANNNNFFDTSIDIPLVNNIIAGSPYYAAATDSTGLYQMYMDFDDTSDISLANGYNPNYFSVSPASYTVITDTSSQIFSGRDFVLTALGSQTDLGVHISQSLHRPGFDNYFVVSYSNVGNTVINSGNLSLDLDAQISFISASESAVQSGQNLAWTFSNLQPFETRQIEIMVNVPVSVPLGNFITYNLSGTLAQTDADTSNNFAQAQNTVVGAYDPNDINANKDGILICVNSNEENEDIFYKIRFQNTGTFYAEDVIVQDTLSNYLDISTLQTLAASHAYSLEIQNVLRNNQPAVAVKWIFNNINLIDSFTNEPLSHGFIEFKIKPKGNLVATQVFLQPALFIESQAHIYFDFNAPVNTNIDSIQAVICVGVNSQNEQNTSFKIIPNPNNGNFILNASVELETANLFIYSQLGELVHNQKVSGNNPQISLKALPKGVYFMQVQTSKGNFSQKMILE